MYLHLSNGCNILAVKVNGEWIVPTIGEFIYKDRSGYYVFEKVGLHPIHGSGSVITRVFSENDIEDMWVKKLCTDS